MPGTIDLETSRFVLPPKGAEFYIAPVPAGSRSFTAGLTK